MRLIKAKNSKKYKYKKIYNIAIYAKSQKVNYYSFIFCFYKKAIQNKIYSKTCFNSIVFL